MFDRENYNPDTRTFIAIKDFGARTFSDFNRVEFKVQFSKDLKLKKELENTND